MRTVCALGLAALLCACSGSQAVAPVGEPPVGDWVDVLPDGKPGRDIAAGDVGEAVPRPDPVLAAGNTSPYRVNGETHEVMASGRGYRERGIASWYGRKFQGRRTANGEVFDPYIATAAHRNLPLPSYVRVTNLVNGNTLVVRVNDRGPFFPGRIIDLSYGAAVKLGFAKVGTAPVEVEAVDVEGVEDLRSDPLLGDWQSDYRFLQVAAFRQRRSAETLRRQLAGRLQLKVPVAVSELQREQGVWHRVRVGPIEDRLQLLALREQLVEMGYSNVQPMPE